MSCILIGNCLLATLNHNTKRHSIVILFAIDLLFVFRLFIFILNSLTQKESL